MNARTTALLGGLAVAGVVSLIFFRNRAKAGDAISSALSGASELVEDFTVNVQESLAITWPYPRGKEYEPLFTAATKKYGLPVGLLARQAWQESRFRDDIISGQTISPAGAIGIMQIVPKWHPGVNPRDVAQSVDYAAKYDAQLFKQFGSWELALAAYNWGPGNIQKYASNKSVWPGETQAYVSQILSDVKVA